MFFSRRRVVPDDPPLPLVGVMGAAGATRGVFEGDSSDDILVPSVVMLDVGGTSDLLAAAAAATAVRWKASDVVGV